MGYNRLNRSYEKITFMAARSSDQIKLQ